MNDFLGNSSPVSAAIANYEPRSQQIEMARRVQDSITDGAILAIEAGCGVGKSFAYLIPFILWAFGKEENRVAVSTYTKTLQHQLIEKDIPLLRKALGIDFKAALCLGSENYLCVRKMETAMQFRFADSAGEAEQLEQIREWSLSTDDGLKMNIDFAFSENVWSDVCRYPDICHERKCSCFSRCFYYRARKKQAEADILILNHHLLLNDVASGWNILPRYNAIVFDEAHNLEDVASDTLGLSVSMVGSRFLLSRIHKAESARCLLNRYCDAVSDERRQEVAGAVNTAKQAVSVFFTEVLDEFGTGRLTHRINLPGMFNNCLSGPMKELGEILESISEFLPPESEARIEFRSFARRCRGIAEELNSILSMELENYVYYLQIKTRRDRISCSFNATPVEVSALLKKLVFEQISPVILTSATLTVNNSFDFITGRLGIEGAATCRLDSPYDYRKKALLYMPEGIPDPSFQPALFQNELTEKISELLEVTGGRTFVLFTSYEMLNRTASGLTDRFPGIRFLVQGELSRKQMIDEFTRRQDAVIMGTSTFWQGVDFPGRLLECVIITKLPFAVPNDPVVEARIENLKKAGKNAFMEYQVPVAALMFKQGFGRLLRHRDDFGIVAALDPRIRTKRYGSFFCDSLPECAEVTSIEELKRRYNSFLTKENNSD